jgi:hypothetical protein
MYRRQIALLFSDFGLESLYEKFEVPLDIHGVLDDPDTLEMMEYFLSMYNFQSPEFLLFDEFLNHYNICTRIIQKNPDLPFYYIDLYHSSDEISL